ncbi:MAG: hypothetical protein ACK4K1_04370 [Flavobacterium sp.]
MKRFFLWQKILIALASIFIILFTVLVVHIANAPSLEVDNAHIQVSAATFSEEISLEQMQWFQQEIKQLPQVINPRVDKENKVLVFFYNNTQTSSKEILETLFKKTGVQTKLFQLHAEQQNQRVCPAMDPDSFKYRFSVFIQRIFQ